MMLLAAKFSSRPIVCFTKPLVAEHMTSPVRDSHAKIIRHMDFARRMLGAMALQNSLDMRQAKILKRVGCCEARLVVVRRHSAKFCLTQIQRHLPSLMGFVSGPEQTLIHTNQ